MTDIVNLSENVSILHADLNPESVLGQMALSVQTSSQLVSSSDKEVHYMQGLGGMNNIPKGIAFPQVHRLRMEQARTSDLSHLTPVQWGLVDIDKCHHISTTVTSKDSPPSYRVRVCKTCCKQDNHIELGTYVDQESAVLINDVHEILQERYDRLVVLVKEDRPYLHLLQAKKYDRQRGRDHTSILKILAERSQPRDEKKKRKRLLDGSVDDGKGSPNTFTGRSSDDGRSSATSLLEDESSSASGKYGSIDGYESAGDDVVGTGNLVTGSVTTDGFNDSPLSPAISKKTTSALDAVAAAAAIESAAAALLLATVGNELASDSESYHIQSTPKRPRANTITLSSPTKASVSSALSPMTTLTWVAAMKDDELDAARLLSELGDSQAQEQKGESHNHYSDISLEEEAYLATQKSSDKNSHGLRPLTGLGLRSGMVMPAVEGRRGRSNSLPFLKSSEGAMYVSGGRSRTDSFSSDVLAISTEIGFIGIYSPEERKKRILRFLEKRKTRIWTKKVKYDVRKNFADSRIRVKGRFVRKEDEEQLKVVDPVTDVFRPKKRNGSKKKSQDNSRQDSTSTRLSFTSSRSRAVSIEEPDEEEDNEDEDDE